MAKKDPNILYSQGCDIALEIGERFYGDMHYAWCAPTFGSSPNPPSSAPVVRYKRLAEDVETADSGSSAISLLRTGIKKGELSKY